jgi:hypothetical protein
LLDGLHFRFVDASRSYRGRRLIGGSASARNERYRH